MGLAQQVLATIRHEGLIRPGDRVVAAVSGGGDSVAMLHVLAELARPLGCELHVAHLDHGIRAEASAEARFVAQLAARLRLPATIELADVPTLRAAAGGSLEHVARSARYDFLHQVARRLGAQAIATGHTADDQIETVLHNLLRGASLRTLGGMSISRPVVQRSPIRIIRPMLRVSRIEVLSYLAENSIDFCSDASNADLSFTRNRIRHELLPLLEARFNPSVGEAILRAADAARAAARIVDPWVDEFLPHVLHEDAALLCEPLLELQNGLRALVVERSLERLCPGAALSHRHVDAVAGLLHADDGTMANLAAGWRARRTAERIELLAPAEEAPQRPLDELLAVPGHLSALDGALVIRAELVEPSNGFVDRFLRDKTPWEELIDADAAGRLLHVRWKRDGDRFHPLGGPGFKKLQDFFVDARVPAWQRSRIPLVVANDRIVWVVGQRIDERVRITSNTRRFLLLRAQMQEAG